MSTEKAHLALRLVGPMQAWGFESQYNRRNTGRFPTKSALAGLICAALGASRGSTKEKEVLDVVRTSRLLVVAVPRQRGGGAHSLSPRKISDYHTVQNTVTAEGKPKDTHLTYRQYLNDACFVAVLSGERNFLSEAAQAIDNPRWGVWLGRKACIPAEPVFVGLFGSEQEALDRLLGGRSLTSFSRQRETERFDEGGDTLPDSPVCFDSNARMFGPRRVRVFEPGEQ